MSREAMQQALEALESCDAAHISDGGQQWYDEKAVEAAITALRAALEAQQEPVALMWQHEETGRVTFTSMDDPYPGKRWHRVPLYAAPQPAHPPAQPHGWVLVPEEPTPEMVAAGEEPVVIGFAVDNYGREVAGKAYRAMLAARPKETA